MNVLKVMKSFVSKCGHKWKAFGIVSNAETIVCQTHEARIEILRPAYCKADEKTWESVTAFELDQLAPHEQEKKLHGFYSETMVSLCARDLVDALDFCIPATDTESTRYALGGVLFDRDSIVATDGRRLHRFRNFGSQFPQSDSNIVATRHCELMRELAKQCEVVSFDFVGNWTSVCFHEIGVFCKFEIVSGRYPMWEKVIPSGQLQYDRIRAKETYKSSCEIVKRTKLEDKLRKESLSKSDRKNFEKKTPTIDLNGATLNASYVAEALAIAKENEIELLWESEQSAHLLQSHCYQAVIMPMSK